MTPTNKMLLQAKESFQPTPKYGRVSWVLFDFKFQYINSGDTI